MTRYGVAFSTELKNHPREPYELLRVAWLAAIEPYQQVDPPLKEFHLTSGIMQTACKVYALLPLDEAMQHAAVMAAAISYPAFVETVDGKKAWSVLKTALEAAVSTPEPLNQRFQERNPVTSAQIFDGAAFTATQAEEMLQRLRTWARQHAVRLP